MKMWILSDLHCNETDMLKQLSIFVREMHRVTEYMALILHGQWIPDWGCSGISFYPSTQCHRVETHPCTIYQYVWEIYTNAIHYRHILLSW